MFKDFFRFILFFVVLISGGYFTHRYTVDALSISHNLRLINTSYLLNSGFTLILILGIVLLYKRFKDQVGFIFMGGSLIKMALFMSILKLNGYEINKNAFLDFFIPYVICLILEVYYISKILKTYN